ncbi:MAG: hypothetical protein Q4A43_01380 [Coriobacteriia bacterium]|nr:hypothetical protein [Coriobacteriia bacterium]
MSGRPRAAAPEASRSRTARSGSRAAAQAEASEKSRYSRDSYREASKSRAEKRERKRLWIFLGAFVAVLVAVAVALSWNLWWRYDDAADIQGTWAQSGTDNEVVITDSSIYLTSTLFYSYSLDTDSKHITFTFEGKEGSGVYSFSDDRNTLTIAEVDVEASSDESPNIYTTLTRVQDSSSSSSSSDSSTDAASSNTGDASDSSSSSDSSNSAS